MLIGVTVGKGLTVIENVTGVPGQPFALGVTVIRPVIFELPELVVANAGIVGPLPLAAKPIAVLSLVQAKVAPVVLLANVIKVELLPAQMV